MKGLWWAHRFSRTNSTRVQFYKDVYQKQLAFTKVLAAGPHGCSAKLGLSACLHASLSVWVWPSQTEYCHKESSMPGAHLHITSLKQKSRGALMQDGCLLKWRIIFISVPHKAAIIPAPGVVFLTTFCVIPEATLWSGPLVGNTCFSDFFFVCFTPGLLDSQFPYIPLSLLCQYHRNLFLPFRCLKSKETKEKEAKSEGLQRNVAFALEESKSMHILIVEMMKVAWLYPHKSFYCTHFTVITLNDYTH